MARPLREIQPTQTSKLKLYSSSTVECLERLEGNGDTARRICGKSSRCGRYSWLFRGSALEVINPVSGCRLSAWRFGWSVGKKLSLVISCAIEYPTSNGIYILVGLQNVTVNTGMLCVFDPVLSRVIKAIELPRSITFIEYLTTSGGVNAPHHSISSSLCEFYGCVAVGARGGHVYLVDLRLDDDVEEFDEWNPSTLEIVDADDPDTEVHRISSRENGTHVAFELGGECHDFGRFTYVSSEGEDLGSYPSNDVSVTCLAYIRQLGSLIVGYSFGCFQIWDLEQHTREFSSSFGVYVLPVTHVTYQEPENDPRLCCYLWVARGQTGDEDVEDMATTTITLYQLIYERKENLPGYGRVLKDFSGCGGRFEHQLTGDPYHLADATTCGSKVLCFYTLDRDEVTVDVTRMDDSSDEIVSRDLTLVVCVWEAPAVELYSSPSCHMAVFDINRWYHSQMPPSVRDAMYGSKDPTCPFLSVYSLADVLDTATPDALVDVSVRPNEITRFSTTYGALPEQFFWASSLTFDVACLMETGVVSACFYGAQLQVLNDLKREGINALNDAYEYFHRCWTASLMPKNFDFSRAQEKTFQVEGLLSVALEHNLTSFIISCIQELGEDNITYAGCNLRVILEWAWDQVIQMKHHLDQLCVPLFDGTGIFVDNQLVAILDHYSVQLNNLVDIFETLSSAALTTEQGVKELESQHTVCFLLNQYLRVVLFFVKQRLLPELFDNNEEGELSSQYYPGDALLREYATRRKELKQCDSDSLGSLMIDRILSTVCENMDESLWTSGNRWPDLYPSPNLHALCSLILQEKINPTSKICIIYYALLDLCSLNPQFRTKKVADKFAAAFGLQPVLVKLFHGFWCLDHKDFDNALKDLIASADQLNLAPWQNSHIVRLFLEQGESKRHFCSLIQ
ncbi:protein ELYS-like isoform X2 [Xenia sp. Carnegie-2017]|uniref:protein ELYS-like isoform X2 n=1 Tax=Xenia sp. Carnegie-2017 TaxID=2897299 RepID=UPI001F044D49|nr:protein ELYS-like isoform X2 [Xenia sp. Carnegie-2017]